MKKFRKLVIGGIESKIVLLIIIAMAVSVGVILFVVDSQSRMLTDLAADTTELQLVNITDSTAAVVDAVIEENMVRITDLRAQVTDGMFHDLAVRVQMVGEYALKLFEEADSVPRMPYYRPDEGRDGELFVKVLYASGEEDPDLADRLGLIANMSEMMRSVCEAYGADNIWFSLPEGATLMADTVPGKWVRKDGSFVAYDAASRYWYRQAVEEGQLVFSDVELDRRTGEMCITCALPVYGPDGTLYGVAGADLYLTDMQHAVEDSVASGGYLVVINQDGHVIISPEDAGEFYVLSSANAKDLRRSDNAELAGLITDALGGQTEVRLIGLGDGRYYMAGVPMRTVGWALIAVYSEAAARQPVDALRDSYQKIQQEATDTYRAEKARSRRMIIVLLIAIQIVMIGGALIAGKRIVKPLNTITRRITESKEGSLAFTMEDTYRTGDEVEALAQAFADLSQKSAEYVEQIKSVTAEKERFGTELRMATKIQESMLPSIFPPYPERKEFDLYATMDPAKEVGGDFYDFFLLDDDHLALVMADVSGKGIPAALFMMVSKAILKNNAMMGKSAGEILTAANDTICSNNKMQMFVTVWMGILEISTGKITAANAGHEYPALRRCGGGFELFKDKHGFVVGGMEGVRYKEYELTLKPGDRLFLYTDGVPEASDAGHALFGTDRMLAALNEHADGSARDILRGVRESVDAFVGDAEQFDDLTMLCLEYRGPGYARG